MRRSVVFSVAGAALGLAAVLTLLGVGDDPSALTNGQALVLGIVQGLTELLPISSSGHLILVPWGAEWTYLEQNDRFNQTFDVALHLGTLVAVGAYFWKDVVRLARALVGSVARGASRPPTSGSPGSCSSPRFRPALRGSSAQISSPIISESRGRSSSCSPAAHSSCCGRIAHRRHGSWATSASGMRSSWGSRRPSRSHPASRARESRSLPGDS